MTIGDVSKAVSMRVSGTSFSQIAEECGFPDAATAQVAVRDALTKASGFDPGTEIMTDLARLDRLLAGLWTAGAADGDEGMARAALKIIGQRAELLALADDVGVKEAGPATALDKLKRRRATRGAS